MDTNKYITFCERFVSDIVSGKKTITIRDEEAAYYQPGDIVEAYTEEKRIWFARLSVININALNFEDIDCTHAVQENMTMDELKKVIREIYPDTQQLHVITFRRL